MKKFGIVFLFAIEKVLKQKSYAYDFAVKHIFALNREKCSCDFVEFVSNCTLV